ncbi:MAG: ABC transporter substrate-binding protein [Deltaproteobacteria bacterium]|jgi:iron complex transport system substrate-binding protein|nr:ABC transporter substrate-binding protein [Deltaproteobacteria bacterium]
MLRTAALWAAVFFWTAAWLPEARLGADGFRTLTDMLGREVRLPSEIKKAIAVDDGLTEEVLINFGLIDRLAGISSQYLLQKLDYSFAAAGGERISYQSRDVLPILYPGLENLPACQAWEGGALNFETLAKIQPDLVILRAGDCGLSLDEVRLRKTIQALESFGWPVAVLTAPGYDRADTETLKAEIRLLGEIFNSQEKAADLTAYLASLEETVQQRVSSVPEGARVTMLYLGLASFIRKMSAAASAMGSNSPVSFMMEQKVRAKNAFRGQGFGVHLSTEQIYALDPDVLVLSPLGGFHPPRELYEHSDFADLAGLKAVRNRRVYAMPWRATFCGPRLQYILDLMVMAKAAYPDKFQDLNIYSFALDFYQKIYRTDRETAEKLRSAQLLDWMAGENF